ncbi:hypothetical protein [Streptomyces acidiscabies]|uniref:hypothetical protein n=1 Tax=Streptomyces acidiscabies TaxID=42234 RepID=UPI0038F6FF38
MVEGIKQVGGAATGLPHGVHEPEDLADATGRSTEDVVGEALRLHGVRMDACEQDAAYALVVDVEVIAGRLRAL